MHVYVQMAFPCKRPPHFLTREFQEPMDAYLAEYGSSTTCSLSDAHNYYFAPLLFSFTGW